MRISDWSSDVCSSDLADGEADLFLRTGRGDGMSHPSSWQAGDTDLQNRYRRFSKLAATKSRSRGDRRIVRATSVTTVSNIWNGALRRKAPCSKGALRTPLPESTANNAKAITLAHSARDRKSTRL